MPSTGMALTYITPTTSGFPFEQQKQQPELINEAGSPCISDSVEEENEIDEQSGRTIQREIPQSQRGKRKQYLSKIILGTASVPFRFFIQLSSQKAHTSFPSVYWKLHQYPVVL